ncbi:MAG: shikimate dehydrogenase [Deltaproteobacteria bacterium]|nr:shikimate dehydrogenase [Deltaproteobacteria bacterium]
MSELMRKNVSAPEAEPTFWRLGLLGGERAIFSLSPAMHRRALTASNLQGDYSALNVRSEDLAETVKTLWEQGFGGLNVTAPHKLDVIGLCVGLAEEAREIGSVNTLIRRKDGFFGETTDARGFVAAYGDAFDGRPSSRTLLLGAGGAARAAVAALKRLAVAPRVAARNADAAGRLARDFGLEVAAWPLASEEAPFDVVVNAASASSAAQFDPPPGSIKLNKGGLVIDLNYGREDNMFEALARRAGATFFDGLPMLAQQARLSFRLWTGRDPGSQVFQDALLGQP